MLDSYGLPLDTYGVPHVLAWIWRYFPIIHRNERSLQSLNSSACGHYTQLFLQAKCRGQSMHDFLNEFSLHDLVANDHEAGHRIQAQLPPSLRTDLVDGAIVNEEDSQTCCSRHEAMYH